MSARLTAPRRVLLLRATAALAAAVALGLAALLLSARPEVPAPWPQAAPPAAQPAAESVAPSRLPAVVPVPVETSTALALEHPEVSLEPAASPAPASAENPAAPASTPPSVPEVPEGVLLPHAAASGGGPGYRIQLGVFGDPANALQLYERLAAEGYAAGIQSRVVLGPFADRDAAERARRKLREGGQWRGRASCRRRVRIDAP